MSMNSTITFIDKISFATALNVLALNSTPNYEVETRSLTIYAEELDGILDVLFKSGITDFRVYRDDLVRDDDIDHDADVLHSAGWGTDEEYEHNLID